MGESVTLKLADFSKFPSGRDDNDSDFNGKKYRDEILAPAIKAAIENDSQVIVSLHGVLSFGSSFLEEAFGGLVRHNIASASQLKRVLEIDPGQASYERFKQVILEYIKSAKGKAS